MRGLTAVLAVGAAALACSSIPRVFAQDAEAPWPPSAEAPPPPSAEAPPPPAPSRAEEAGALARQADALAAEGRADEALAAYRASFAQRRDPRVAARLGELALTRGDVVLAATHLDIAARAEGVSPEELDAIEARLAQAKHQVGELHVRSSALLAEVWVDGARAGFTTDPALFVAPGQHVVEIRGAGYHPARRDITIAAGEAQDLSFTLERAAPQPPLEQQPAEPPAEPPAPPPVSVIGRAPASMAVVHPRAPSTGKSMGFIGGGYASAAMLAILGGFSLGIPDSEPHQVMGAALLIGGGVLAAGTTVYVLWPQATPSSAGVAFAGAF